MQHTHGEAIHGTGGFPPPHGQGRLQRGWFGSGLDQLSTRVSVLVSARGHGPTSSRATCTAAECVKWLNIDSCGTKRPTQSAVGLGDAPSIDGIPL